MSRVQSHQPARLRSWANSLGAQYSRLRQCPLVTYSTPPKSKSLIYEENQESRVCRLICSLGRDNPREKIIDWWWILPFHAIYQKLRRKNLPSKAILNIFKRCIVLQLLRVYFFSFPLRVYARLQVSIASRLRNYSVIATRWDREVQIHVCIEPSTLCMQDNRFSKVLQRTALIELLYIYCILPRRGVNFRMIFVLFSPLRISRWFFFQHTIKNQEKNKSRRQREREQKTEIHRDDPIALFRNELAKVGFCTLRL